MEVRLDRARGALWGLAVGDGLGMPTQSFSRAQIAERWGLLDGYEPGPPDQPIAPGLPAGTVTDDTEQALLLARAVIAGGGRVNPLQFAESLASWEDDMRARGSLDLLGPSTRRAIAALRSGVAPSEAGREGTTNGAAMRICPIGIAFRSSDLNALVDAVVQASEITHNTGVALAGAAAVAAAVSAGIDGAGVAEAVELAGAAAALAGKRGRWVAAADVAARIRWAYSLTAGRGADAMNDIYSLVGTGLASQESVPAAFGVLAAIPNDPWLACRHAASLGGDTDTIAAIVGAIAGACLGASRFPKSAIADMARANDLPLDQVVDQLLALRR